MHRAYGLLVLLIALPAWAAGPIVIGQSLPLTGPAYPIANRIQAGAKALVDRTAKAEPQALVLNLGPEVLDLLSHGGGATREGVPPIVATLSSAGLTQLTRLFRDERTLTQTGDHGVAKIIGGIGTSHVPTIGVAYDKGKQNDPAWAPLFEGYKPVAAWLAEKQADVLVFFYNDHCTTFFFDMYPTFALGVGERFPVADEGAGLRNLPAIRGNVEFQAHIAESLVNDEFDLTVFQDKPIDHGCAAPLPLLWPHVPDWPGTVVPIAINVLQYPLPTGRRCHRLGQAVRRAVESYPQELRVVVVGTGGLSHQIHGERTGFNNTEWDMEFLDLLESNPQKLVDLPHSEYVRLGGAESVEQIMWLAMRGALGDRIRKLHQNYYLATTTAMTVVLYEDDDSVQAS